MKCFNERGNASFYLIWIIFIACFLIVLILNISGVYVGKQKALNTSEHAAIAATAVFYEGIREAVKDYDNYQIIKFYQSNSFGVFPEEEKLSYKIEKKKDDLKASGYSENEASIQAIDFVVQDELPGLDGMLKTYVNNSINAKLSEMRQAASYIIQSNDAELNKSKLIIFHGERIQVKAAIQFEGKKYENYISKIVEDIPQTGSGPKIDFANQLGRGEEVYTLYY